MKLSLKQLEQAENDFHYDSRLPGDFQEWVRGLKPKGYEFLPGLVLDLSVTRTEPNFYLRGRLEGSITQRCSRCAEDFPFALKHPFDLAVFKDGLKTESRENLDEVYELKGEVIELTPILDEQLAISLPFQPLCQEGCLGVCQRCGKNLNVEKCQCKKEISHQPFSVLKGIKFDQ